MPLDPLLIPTPNDASVRLFQRLAALEARLNSFDATSAVTGTDAGPYTVASGANISTSLTLTMGDSFAPATDQLFVAVVNAETWTDPAAISLGYQVSAQVYTVSGGAFITGQAVTSGGGSGAYGPANGAGLILGSSNTLTVNVHVAQGTSGYTGFARNIALRIWNIS
jgi:hypothetical protein